MNIFLYNIIKYIVYIIMTTVKKTYQECLNDLNIQKAKYNEYKDKWTNWDKEITKELANRETEMKKVEDKDTDLRAFIVDKFTNNSQWRRIGNCTWDDKCKLACEIEFNDKYLTTPLQKSFFWFIRHFGENKRFKQDDKGSCRSFSDAIYFDTKGYCYCEIPPDDILNQITAKKKEITDIQANIKNVIQPKIDEISSRMPKPVSITLECCINKIDCEGGICRNDGNIQICEIALTNQITGNQYDITESRHNDSIEAIYKSIDEILKEINSLSTKIYIESYKIYSLDNNNINEKYEKIKTIYEQINVYFNKVQEFIRNINSKKNEAEGFYNQIRFVSSFKVSAQKLLELINLKITNINNTVSIINTNYNYVKSVYEIINKENNDIKLLNLNKIDINNNINLILESISTINSLYESIMNLNILSNLDLMNLNDLFNDSQNIIINIKKSKDKLDEYYTTFSNKFQNFPKNSDFYNVVLEINRDVRQLILNINTQLDDANNTIRNINNIYSSKKENYEIELIRQEQLLLEEQQQEIISQQQEYIRQEEELEKYRLKLIEEENNILNSLINDNVILPISPTPNQVIDVPKNDITLYWVIPLAVILAGILIFFIIRYIKNNSKKNNSNNNS